MNDQPEVGRTLVRSFLAVVLGIIIALLGYRSLSLLVVALFFPADWKLLSESMKQKAAAREEAREKGEDPPIPAVVKLSDASYTFCPLLLAASSFMGGWVVARLAPMSHVGHGFLVAGFLILTTVQLLLRNDSPEPAWLLGINALIGPVFVIWGANTAARNLLAIDDESEHSLS